MKTLVVASKNKGKIKEFKRLLSDFSLLIKGQPENLEVKETGNTFSENARLKALSVSRYSNEIALADDSGLCVESLDGAPGIFSSRYANSDFERISRLLKDLEGCSNRRAFFSCALCIASPIGEILVEVEGRCDGLIVNKPRGKNGFGYDPIFEVLGTQLTFSEMSSYQKEVKSHRTDAFNKLVPELKKIFNF